MSYEHCDKHDEDATNGCASCHRELLDRMRLVIVDTIRQHQHEAPEQLFDSLLPRFKNLFAIEQHWDHEIWEEPST